MLKRQLLIGFLTILLSACGKQAPTFSDNDWHGKWVIINYWATWCEPCRQEIPELNTLHDDRSEKFIVVGVNYDEHTDVKLKTDIKKMNIEFPVLQHNPAAALSLPDVTVVPTTFILNPEGQLFMTLHGPQTATHIKKILNG